MQATRRLPATLGVALLALCPAALHADIVVTELMAANRNTLQDEDGNYSDWFEIYNDEPTTVDLTGYYATDDPLDMTKWRFPAVSIPPGEFLVVFASEKNRRNPSGELHTNFRLGTRGEYFAIVEPDGVTVAFHYTPQFPRQVPDVSYGVSQSFTEVDFVLPGKACRTLIPAGSLPANWTSVTFSDSAWAAGSIGVGYETENDYQDLIATDLGPVMRNQNSSALVRIPFSASSPESLDNLTLLMKYDDGFAAYLNGQEVARRNAPSTLAWNSRATAEHGQPDVSTMSQSFDTAGTSYTLNSWGTNDPPVVRTGGPTGSYLRLMPPDVGNLNNTIGFNAVSGPTGAIFAEFDYRMPSSGCADGFAFALIETATYGQSGAPPHEGFVWERPVIPDAFAVGFDIWDNGCGQDNTVNINWDGAEIRGEFVQQFELNNGVFNRVQVSVVQDGNDSLVDVTIIPDYHGNRGTPVSVVNNLRITGMSLRESRVAFGGRTGGAFTAVDLDNIQVQFTPGSNELAYEAFDLTDHLPLLRSGTNVLAIHGLNLSSSDEDFLVLPELFGVEGGTINLSARRYFPEPTPGWFNSEGLAGLAAEPIFSHPAGAYGSNFSLTISSPSAGAQVRYTTDGTEPTATSTLVGGSFTISSTRLIKARAFEAGKVPSPTVTNLYMRLNSNVRTFSSNLPIVVLDTRGAGVGTGSLTPAQALFVDTQATDGRADFFDPIDFGGSVGIKYRGSSSLGFPKKQFALEVWDENREDRDQSLLGMPEESDWILYAPYSDKALMRNFLSYKWSNDIGQYAVRCRFVELFYNTGTGNLDYNSHYWGVYVFMEKIKRNPERVDIERLTPGDNSLPEVAGGYMVKNDRLDPGDSGFSTARGQPLAFVEPKENEITPAQRSYLIGYLNDFESALYGPNFRSPTLGYAAYFDPLASIDHHILVELTKNIDGYRLSTFAYKPRFGRLTMGPIWDYNLSLGNANYLEGEFPQGWYYPQIGGTQYPWYPRLFQDPDYVQQYIDRWTALRRGPFQTDVLVQDVDDTAALLAESAVRNFQRWDILGTYVWPNAAGYQSRTTFQSEVNWMRNWLVNRLQWMDSQYVRPPLVSEDSRLITPGFELAMNTATGTIYYTRDGSDPRLPGGGISPAAEEYGFSASGTLLSPQTHSRVRALVPTSGTLGTSWVARTFNDSSWTLGTSGIGVGYENGSGYESLIDLDVGAAMSGTNASVYIRIEFDVADPSEYSFMNLGMKYDDGFVAYLNGQRIAASPNAPASPQWDSSASGLHDDALAVEYENYDVSNFVDRLVVGTNVLAIHGLNESTGSSDAVWVPILTATGAFSGDAIVLDDFTRIFARSYQNGEWSGPTQATYALDDARFLRITELFYHPPDPALGSPYNDEDFEFLEIQNISAQPIDLRGVRLTRGVEFDFADGTVPTLFPGEYVVLVKNLAAFETIFDTTNMLVAGEYTGNLENQGETIRLENAVGGLIQEFTYQDFWHPTTDGGGPSLVIVDPGGSVGLWNAAESWMPSDLAYGSPGTGDDISGGRQLPGDANQDSMLDIGDAVALLFQLFRSAQFPPPCDGASVAEGGNVTLLDFNGDQLVDISDPIAQLTFHFLDGLPHAQGTFCIRIEGCPSACVR